MRLSVGMKLSIGFLVVLLLTVALGLVSMNTMRSINRQTKQITSVWMPGVETINNINYLTEHVRQQELRLLIEPDNSLNDMIEKDTQNTLAQIEQQLQQYSGFVSNEDEKQHYELLKKEWNNYKSLHAKYVELAKEVDIVKGAGKRQQEVVDLLRQSEKSYNAMQKVLDALVKINHDGAAETAKTSDALYAGGFKTTITFVVIALLLGALLATVITRLISGPVRNASLALNAVSNGDLTGSDIRYRGKDELGDLVSALNRMKASLSAMMHDIQNTSSSVAASSEELFASSEQASTSAGQVTEAILEVAAGSDSQLQTSAETNRAMDELALGVQNIAENATEVSDMAIAGFKHATEGREAIVTVNRKITEVNESIQQAASDIGRLEEHSNNIGQIVEMMAGIANQTNLLALNAGIEAARAGEHGKGFAVVASEIRKLSDQSGNAAKQIAELVEQVQNDTARTVHSMRENAGEMTRGMQAVSEASHAFEEIVRMSENISGRVQEVAASAEEMAAGTEEIAASVAEISSIARNSSAHAQTVSAASQEQLASVEDIASSAGSLSEIAQHLNELTAKFKLKA
ncbi:HAMP domain-containing methyl-accepting chemotaxis protein [Paenibacillus filicis]|uniref:HAMP domain-containing methyl-accepting chemotaxis protein n=1 Tax=Paenibacillus gyeongsangnamensis TaxID=3388067 RepID=A0ABT4Q9D8_9BACL|nr:HAMP domain-containing methyl-accepting chemotaxis protein [Paenibacillus filicis]MCZ8513492.1 HAMP domain-containing methyl-accepting chemotaxis protein [Paenibacillus filicis]